MKSGKKILPIILLSAMFVVGCKKSDSSDKTQTGGNSSNQKQDNCDVNITNETVETKASVIDGKSSGDFFSWSNNDYIGTIKESETIFHGTSGEVTDSIRLASGSKAGKLSIEFTYKILEVTLEVANYNKDNSTFKVNGINQQVTKSVKESAPEGYDSITLKDGKDSFSIDKLLSIEAEAKNRIYIHSIKFTLQVSTTTSNGGCTSIQPSGSENTSGSVNTSTQSSDSTNTPSNWTMQNNSYYKGKIDLSLRNAQLKTNLSKIIKNHTDHGYGGLYEGYKTTDVDANGKIWDMYSNQHFSLNDNNGTYKKEGDMYNREHTIPQSVFNENAPMKSDIHHVIPTDGYVNNRRSNYPHAEVSNASFTSSNNTKVGSSKTSGVSGSVCEPADEYKGDFARMYFYFVTAYQDRMESFKSYASFSKDSYPSLSKWAQTLYKKWSKEDPVSKKEIDRNNAAYNFQGNRNPFIDFPGLEDLIWN